MDLSQCGPPQVSEALHSLKRWLAMRGESSGALIGLLIAFLLSGLLGNGIRVIMTSVHIDAELSQVVGINFALFCFVFCLSIVIWMIWIHMERSKGFLLWLFDVVLLITLLPLLFLGGAVLGVITAESIFLAFSVLL